MAVGFSVHFFWFSIGTGSFLNSFFSAISYHLEPDGWGTKYPILMNDAYQGNVDNEKIPKLLKEVQEIRELLKRYKPSQVIWDIEDLSKQPPWGDKISPHITSLSNYFVTSDGDDLFEIFIAALNKAITYKVDLEIRSL